MQADTTAGEIEVSAGRAQLPPVWLMGLTNMTFGLYGGFCAVTLPSMLAERGIGGGEIAGITATILSASIFSMPLAPMLDVRLSRRTYASALMLLAAAGMAVTILFQMQPQVMEIATFLGFFCASLVQSAVGGWMGSLVTARDDSGLGAWFTVANIGAGGIMMLVAGQVITRLPAAPAALILASMLLAPMLIFPLLPAPGPDRKLAGESYAQFFGEVASLVRRRPVQLALVLFLMPSAAFSLTNVLGGVGRDFGASEQLVGLLAGVGSSVAGVAGSLLLPPLARKLALRPLYLAIGVAGALFTFSLVLLPRLPWVFAVAISGENLFQSLAIAAAAAIIFETIGPGNPLAATLCSLLLAASNVSIIYMGFVDGRAYAWRGLTGSFVTDAALSMTACLGLAAAWRVGHRRRIA